LSFHCGTVDGYVTGNTIRGAFAPGESLIRFDKDDLASQYL